jgi:hypothetical protein
MIRFENTVTISRPRAEVFGYLAELENLPRWNYAIAATRKLDPGPVTVGTRYSQLRTVPARREETFEVAEYEPDAKLTVHGRFGPFTGDLSYLLAADGGSTVLTNAVALDGPRLATRQIRSAVAANLAVLRQILEGPEAHA